jgi:hypothetical protein
MQIIQAFPESIVHRQKGSSELCDIGKNKIDTILKTKFQKDIFLA